VGARLPTATNAIKIVAAFLFAAAAISFVVGVSLLYPFPWSDSLWQLNPTAASSLRPIGKPLAAGLMLLGGALAAAVMGLLRHRPWAWYFAVIVVAMNGAGDIVSFSFTRDWLHSGSGIAVAGVFLFVLTRPSVRRDFRRQSARNA